MNQMVTRLKDRLLRSDLKKYRREISRRNESTMEREQIACLAAMGMAILMQMLFRKTELFDETIFLFVVIALSMAIWFGIRRRIRERETVLFYVWTGMILTADAVFETAVEPNRMGVIFMILLLALPCSILDAPFRVILFTTAASVVYVALSMVYFDGEVFMSDLIRLILVNVLSAIGSVHMSGIQIDLIRQNRNTLDTAEHDGLTAILNRRGGEVTINSCLKRSEGDAFLLIDVDNFKHINDTYGHRTGDLVLQSVAAVVGAIFRSDDVVMRMGGDEFVVYARNLQDETIIRKRLEEIREEIQDIVLSEENQDCVSVSIGCVINRGNYKDYSEIYTAADAVQYQAKKNGKNRYCIGG